MSAPSQDTLDRLKAVVGETGWSDSAAELEPKLTEWRGKYHGRTALLLKPNSTEEVSQIIRICADTQTAIVPQGGNTGLVGGQTPMDNEVLVSLERMRAIRILDKGNAALTVEAGCPLQVAQEAARDAGLLLAVSLASEGSATIGGIVSTNAGGTNVLRYGMTRDQVLGLEVVLPSGDIWHGLTGLRKDNTGYDLKQLFIGAEGTLGIVTAATFQLHPLPKDMATALCAVPTPRAAIELLRLAQSQSGDRIETFELIPRIGIEFAMRHGKARDPLAAPSDWYVLIELATAEAETARPALERILADAAQITDAVMAASDQQARSLWSLREQMSELQRHEGGSIKHDISVPVSAIPDFLEDAIKAVTRAWPGVRPVPFGHAGDGNIHFNLSQPIGADKDLFLAQWEMLSTIVHDIVVKHGGSISAEHGIGQLKRDELVRVKQNIEIKMMKGIKQTLDPLNILNPGKLL